MEHKRLGRVLAATSLALSMAAVVYYAANAAVQLNYIWRPFAVLIIIAIAAAIVMLVLSQSQRTPRQGPMFWFSLILLCDLSLLTLSLLQTLSADPGTASFWQSTLPMAWMAMPFFMLLFVMSYTADRPVPLSPFSWAVIMFSIGILLYMAGATNFVESHSPNNPALRYWGYQSEPGELATLVYAWAMSMGATAIVLLFRAYRRTANRLRRLQTRAFLGGVCAYVGMAVVFDMGVNLVSASLIPPLSFVYSTIMVLFFGYGILRYGLFQISPVSLSSTILDNLSEAVIGLNPNYTIEFANAGARRMLGRSAEQLKGRMLSSLIATPVLAELRSRLTGDMVVSIEDTQMQIGQTVVPVSLSATPVHDERGRLSGYILVAQNISELKQKSLELAREKASVERKVVERTRQLHEEQAKLRASIDALAAGFLLVDPGGRVLIHNRAILTLIGRRTAIENLEDVSTSFGHQLVDACRQVGQTGQAQQLTGVAFGSRMLNIFAGPVSGTQNKPIGVVVLFEDVTERTVLERARDEFFSIASHELRTPLTAIRGNTDMLLRYYPKVVASEGVKAMLGDIYNSSVRLISIVNDFLDVSRLEQDNIKITNSVVDLKAVIGQVAKEMQTVLAEKQLQFIFKDAPSSGTPIWADPNRVKQIVYNLIGNAAIYTQKGSVSVAVVKAGKHVKLTVTDTGPGIPEKNQKFLFRKFQQAGDSNLTRESSHGTGLGLYISRLLAERMGGTLKLEWSKVGAGTSFSLTLPAAESGAPKAN